MRGNFSQLFWGLLLVILDFTINGFDIFPDIVGYLVIAAGCNGLADTSHRFSTARAMAFSLAILWLVGFAVHGEFRIFYRMATTLANCAFMWQLLGGIADFATARGRLGLAKSAINRRAAYVAVLLLSNCFAFALNGSNLGPLVLGMVITMLVLMVMILHLIHIAKHELTEPLLNRSGWQKS